MITISLGLQKGGSGKSTSAETIAAILGSRGKKTLLVDLDPQTSVTFISGATPEYTIIDAITGKPVHSVICNCKYYDLLPGDEKLANLESLQDLQCSIIYDLLRELQSNYEYAILDTPPGLGNILKSTLYASDFTLFVTDPRPLSVKGLDALQDTVDAIRDVCGRPEILGVLLTRYSDRTVLNRQIKSLLEERCAEMNTVLFNTAIHESIVVPEAQVMQTSMIDFAPKSKPLQDYLSIVDEIMDKIGER